MAAADVFQQVALFLEQVVIEHDIFLGQRPMISHYQGWLGDVMVLMAINFALWLLSLIVGKCWPVDFIWSSWPGILAGLILQRSPVKFISPKQYLYLGIIWFWGARLTLNFVSRGGIGHEDWRYTDIREGVGAKWFPLASFFMIFLGQSVFNYFGCLSIYGMLRNRFSVVSALDLLGIIVAVTGVVIETAADEQLDEFRRKNPGQVASTGLWAWCRHPNYVGELTFWSGLWICSGCEIGPALAGPIGLTILFILVSVPMMEERQQDAKGRLYLKYIRDVPSPLVPVPPFLAKRIFGSWQQRAGNTERQRTPVSGEGSPEQTKKDQ